MERQRKPDWSILPPELLELVVTKLHFIDVLCFRAVCSSFRLAAKVRFPVAPLLMHQSTTDHGDDDEFLPKFGKTVRFLSPQDMNAVIYLPQGKSCLERLLDKGCCVGSSHGMLVVLDKEADPFLLNPFSGVEIELPKKETLIGIIHKRYGRMAVEYLTHWTDGRHAMYVPAIKRAILTANPSYAEDYKIFVMCRDLLAFCCRGDRTWRPLRSSENFRDVAFHNGRLYAIQTYPMKICTWELSSTLEVPQECGCVVISDFVQEVCNKFRDCTVIYYLVSSSNELFFVFRFIKANAEPCRGCRTVGFEIYKLEGEQRKEFVRVESLPSRAMFLGGNHSKVISVQEYDNKLKDNSIYFTYDYEDTYLRGLKYEIGIYSLEKGSVNLLCDVQKKRPVPFWVFPGQK